MAGNNFNEIILYEWRGGENVCCWEKSSFHLPLGQGQGTSLFWLTLGPRPGTCLLCICFLPPRFLRWWWGCVYAANDENVYAAVSPHNSPPQLELLSQTQTGGGVLKLNIFWSFGMEQFVITQQLGNSYDVPSVRLIWTGWQKALRASSPAGRLGLRSNKWQLNLNICLSWSIFTYLLK